MYSLVLTQALKWKMWFVCNKALTEKNKSKIKQKNPQKQHNVKRRKQYCTNTRNSSEARRARFLTNKPVVADRDEKQTS